MNYPKKIVGFVIDIHNLTMYQADGETIVVAQGDPRIKPLVAALVAAKTSCDAVGEAFSYMLQSDDMNDKNYFAEAEKQTGGLVRFYRMAKSKVKALVDKFVEPIGFMEVGAKKEQVMDHSVTGQKAVEAVAEVMSQAAPVATAIVVAEEPEQPTPIFPKEDERPLTKSQAAVDEIMAGAVHSSSPNFNNTQGETEETATTIVAVLNDGTIIPGAEALSEQAAAVAQGSGKGTGLANFMRRAGMIKRGHSVEDLLKFVQKGELPLADDGCVLVYKLLKKTRVEGVFVDCHSGNVKQRVGSFVHMDEQLVDPSRSRDCSSGLHVARRDYLGSFYGDVCVLAKLAPEDVIAVPQYDARKLRAKGYHIIAQLSDNDRRLVCGNQPMEDQVLLGNAIAGNHAEITEYVKITESKGGGLVVTTVDSAEQGMPALDPSLAGQSLDHLENKAEPAPEDCQVDARKLALKAAEQKVTAPPGGMNVQSEPLGEAQPVPAPKGVPGGYADGDSYRQQAEPSAPLVSAVVPNSAARPIDILSRNFENAGNPVEKLAAARALLAFKKSAKKSWTALGVSIGVWEAATQLVANAAPPTVEETPAKPVKGKKATKPVVEPKLNPLASAVLGAAKPSAVKKAPAKPKADPKPAGSLATKPVKANNTPKGEKKMTQQEEMAKLVGLYEKNPDKMNARAIYNFKQKAKKGWDVLGVTDTKFIKKITERAKL